MDRVPPSRRLTRRDALKLSGAALAGMFLPVNLPASIPWPPTDEGKQQPKGRVARNYVYLYEEPNILSRKLEKIRRDTIVEIQEEVRSACAPTENPRWHRLATGYVHSAYIQRLDGTHLNVPLLNVPESGILGEVSVPFTQTYWKNRLGEWVPLYRLYYRSVHWITGITCTQDGKPWYTLVDEWLRVLYRVQAEHLRPIDPQELSALSPDLPPDQKLIRVSLTKQELTAYETNRIVFQTPVSTGKKYMETPKGEFQIDRKHASKHMGDGGLSSSLEAYELPGVPWTSFFHPAGIAFHGAYWHDNFGVPMSQGCVNMRPEAALWLFRWTAPTYDAVITDRSQWKQTGKGTRVIVAD